MEERPQKFIDWLFVAEKTEFYTSAELEHVINEVAKRALEERRPITKDDLLASINENPPNLNGNRIERMKSPIGFVP